MADLTKTFTNQVEFFGPAPASYFDLYNWNEFVWGEGTAPLIKGVGKVFNGSISVTQDLSALYLRDGAGWYYNFHDGVTNADSRYEPTWTQVTVSPVVP